MKDKISVVDENQHYFDMGIIEGKSRFNLINFLYGLGIGFAVGIFIMIVLK